MSGIRSDWVEGISIRSDWMVCCSFVNTRTFNRGIEDEMMNFLVVFGRYMFDRINVEMLCRFVLLETRNDNDNC